MDGWDRVGKSIENDITKGIAFIAAGLVALGGVIVYSLDILRYRHMQKRAR